MTVFDDGERFIGDLDGLFDVFVRERRVDEVVVVVRDEDAPLDTFRDPLLVEHEGRVIGDPQVEEGRDAGDVEVVVILLRGLDEAVFQFLALVDEQLR